MPGRKVDKMAPMVPEGTNVRSRRRKQEDRLSQIMSSSTTPDRTKKPK